MGDPWRDCQRRFEPHFYESQSDHSIPSDQVENALLMGSKIPESEKRFDKGQDYEVRWKKLGMKVTLMPCVIVLWTVFLE